MDVLRVSATSPARALAGCIAGVVRENGRAELQAIGAAAVNQAIKAAAIARGFLREDGLEQGEDLVLIITFAQVIIGGAEKTAIRFIAEKR
jgi:stage V sporulation protein S